MKLKRFAALNNLTKRRILFLILEIILIFCGLIGNLLLEYQFIFMQLSHFKVGRTLLELQQISWR